MATRFSFQSRCSRTVMVGLATGLLLGAGAGPALGEHNGEEHHWAAGQDGTFGLGQYWSEGVPPGEGEAAIFDVFSVFGFTVGFDEDHTNDRLLLRDGDVTFDLGGNVYELTNDETTFEAADELSLIVADEDGDVASLALNDGTVSGVQARIGHLSGSDGAVAVGADGELDLTRRLSVGYDGEGELTIADGGEVNTLLSVIGQNSGSSGEMTVIGENSSWTVVGSARVGVAGEGELTIADGGEVNSGSWGTIGSQSGSSGEVTVTGENSTWINDGRLRVGFSGDGELTIAEGGEVSNTWATLGRNSGTSGKVTVTGENSTWTSDGPVTVGLLGEGELTIGYGATAYVEEDLEIGDDGQVNLHGGTLRFDGYENEGQVSYLAGTVQLAGNRDVGLDDAIDDLYGSEIALPGHKGLAIEGVANLLTSVTLEGGLFSVGDLGNRDFLDFQSGTFRVTETMDVGGGPLGSIVELEQGQHVETPEGATIASHGMVRIGDGASFGGDVVGNAGEIVLDGDTAHLTGQEVTNTGLLRGHGRVNASLSNEAGGTVRVEEDQRLVFTEQHNTNEGQVNVTDGQVEFFGGLDNQADGQIHAIGDSQIDVHDGLHNEGQISITQGETRLYGDVNNDGGNMSVLDEATGRFLGDVTHNGDFYIADDSQAVFAAALSGEGDFTGGGDVTVSGTLSPGNSPGMMSFGGDLVLDDASLLMEIAGTDQGETYDHLDVAGLLELGGSLEVALLDDFTPQLGDTFELFSFGQINGQFAEDPLLPELEGGLVWDDQQLQTTGTISVVPEPGSLALLGAGGLLLMRRARKMRAQVLHA